VTPTGLLIVDKPGGMTSHDVVARVRRVLGTRKVGHAGTLDPMATGVLVIGVGQATRLLGLLALDDKGYDATIRLGSSTVTDDREGDVVSEASTELVTALAEVAIRSALAEQVGTIQQHPSAVSAIKVKGRRAYDRVRAGEDVELPARTVTISRLDILAIRRTERFIDLDVEVECSSGTYVRAIARDAGRTLGVGGHLQALRRTRVGPFPVSESVSLEGLGEESLMTLADIAQRCFTTWSVDDVQAKAVALGQRIAWAGPDVDSPVALTDGTGRLLAMARPVDGLASYQAVFAAPSGNAPAGS
jgi:tRNA pseudouridine55 synthase